MTQQGNYQPQPAPHPGHYQQPAPNISDILVGKGKLDLFLLCGGLIMLLGLLFLDLLISQVVDPSEGLLFIALLMWHAGVVVVVSLLMIAGIVREDIPEKTRNTMVMIGGFIAALFIYGLPSIFYLVNN